MFFMTLCRDKIVVGNMFKEYEYRMRCVRLLPAVGATVGPEVGAAVTTGTVVIAILFMQSIKYCMHAYCTSR